MVNRENFPLLAGCFGVSILILLAYLDKIGFWGPPDSWELIEPILLLNFLTVVSGLAGFWVGAKLLFKRHFKVHIIVGTILSGLVWLIYPFLFGILYILYYTKWAVS